METAFAGAASVFICAVFAQCRFRMRRADETKFCVKDRNPIDHVAMVNGKRRQHCSAATGDHAAVVNSVL